MSSVPTEGAALARRKGFPHNFSCAKNHFAALALLFGWAIPLPLRLAAPPSPGGVRHVGTCHAWHEKQRPKPRRKQHHEHHQPPSPHQRNPKQPQQRQTAKEVIAANVKSLIEQLEAGHSDALTAYLDAMSRFHNYSFGNILEIARQKPDATRVAGL